MTKPESYVEALSQQLSLADYLLLGQGRALLRRVIPAEGMDDFVTPEVYGAMLPGALLAGPALYCAADACRAVEQHAASMDDWTLKEGSLPAHHGFLWLAHPLSLPADADRVGEANNCFTAILWNRYDVVAGPGGGHGLIDPDNIPKGAPREGRYLFTFLLSTPQRPAGVPSLMMSWSLGRSFMESVNDCVENAAGELWETRFRLADGTLRYLAALMRMLETRQLASYTLPLLGSELEQWGAVLNRLAPLGRRPQVSLLMARNAKPAAGM